MSAPPAAEPPAAPSTASRAKGYQRWDGVRSASAFRWWVVARGNLRLILAGRWTKVVLIASLLPGAILAGVTYFFLPLSRFALNVVFQSGIPFVFLLGALAGARLIAEDRKQGAFLAHFSRPVTRLDYIAGKWLALAIPLFVVVAASPLIGIAGAAAVDGETVAERIQAEVGDLSDADTEGLLVPAQYSTTLIVTLEYAFIVAATTSGIVLGLSALVTTSRMAGISWFALVGFGSAGHPILAAALDDDWPAYLSWWDNVSDVALGLLGLGGGRSELQPIEGTTLGRVAILTGAALAGLAVVYLQISRAEAGQR